MINNYQIILHPRHIKIKIFMKKQNSNPKNAWLSKYIFDLDANLRYNNSINFSMHDKIF